MQSFVATQTNARRKRPLDEFERLLAFHTLTGILLGIWCSVLLASSLIGDQLVGIGTILWISWRLLDVKVRLQTLIGLASRGLDAEQAPLRPKHFKTGNLAQYIVIDLFLCLLLVL